MKTAADRFPHLYKSTRWQRLRVQFLTANPLCAMCEPMGRVRQARDVDHIKPHDGDAVLFYDLDNLQALCRSCHAVKTAGEHTGRIKGGDVNGVPLDPNHHWNTTK